MNKTSLFDIDVDLENPRDDICSKLSGPTPEINPTAEGRDEAKALFMQYGRSFFFISEKSK